MNSPIFQMGKLSCRKASFTVVSCVLGNRTKTQEFMELRLMLQRARTPLVLVTAEFPVNNGGLPEETCERRADMQASVFPLTWCESPSKKQSGASSALPRCLPWGLQQ